MATITETNGDAGQDSSTQYTLSLGDIFQGVHDTRQDIDRIRVELSSDTIYNFTLRTETESIRFKLVDSEEGLHLHSQFNPSGSTLIYNPTVSGTFYIDIFSFDNNYPLDYEIEFTENTIPIGTYDDLADYITDGYRENLGRSRAAFDVEPGGVLTANITALTEAGKQLARLALEAWSNVTGIEFHIVDDENADITFDDEESDIAVGGASSTDGVIVSGSVNVPASWLIERGDTITSSNFYVYLHEIGHALGLGHAGPYSDPSGAFGYDNNYLIDSIQTTVMSYYSQGDNTYIQADIAAPVTPMIADIIAIQNLYGTPTDINENDTVYGYHSNVDGYMREFFHQWTGQDNPLASVGAEHLSKLEIADLDSDGDLDLVVGATYGNIYYYENTGTADNPEYTRLTGSENPLHEIITPEHHSDHALADMDNDGDIDLIIADINGTIAYHENIGTATNPSFTERTGTANPLDGINKGMYSELSPELADLDGDGDVDLILGEGRGTIAYYENTGTPDDPVFTQRTEESNPFDGIFEEGTRRSGTVPDLADLDGDGDIDLIVGEISNNRSVVNYYENTGTATSPEFVLRADSANPLVTITSKPPRIAPVFADIDNDGDLDYFFGNQDGEFYYAENEGTVTDPDFILKDFAVTATFTLYDTGGTDTLDLRTDSRDQQVDLRPEGISDVYGLVGNMLIARDTVIENFIAGVGNDMVTGNAAANKLEGRNGNDTLNGLAGDDTLYGGPGADTLNGGADDDHLQGGPGADTLNGGPGGDYASYLDSPRGVVVRLHDANAVRLGDAQGDTLTDIEHLIGSQFNDTLAGDGEDNIMEGRDGDDVLYGGPAGGDDRMYGGNGDDRVFGGRGDDTLAGGEGNDVLKGGPGEDVLVVDGNEMDVLYGGTEKDTFRFFPSNLGGGTIRDFSDGEDVIDLTEFADINSMDDLNITSHGDNILIELSSTDYLTAIILSNFDMNNLDSSDFLF